MQSMYVCVCMCVYEIVTIATIFRHDITYTFNRLLHWIEETQEGRCLVQYDLEQMELVVLRTNLVFSTLAENIEQNCIYTIINEIQNITLSPVSLQEDDDNLCVSGLSLNPQGQFISICLT